RRLPDPRPGAVMSTFSGLSTALSSLIAQRQALDVHGQNVANANTPGYTRQRVDLQSVQALSAPTMFSTGLVAGNGVKLVGITRIGDVFLDARVRSETATASFRKAQTAALDRLESEEHTSELQSRDNLVGRRLP